MSKLTERRIRETKPGAKDSWLGDGAGLWLRIRASGTKTFVLRRKQAGKTTIDTLGDWPLLSLTGARRACWERRDLEVNPGKLTVARAVDLFLERVIDPRYRRPQMIRGYLLRDLKPIAGHQLLEVRRADVSRIISEKVEDGPVAANRLLESTKRFFAYCVEMGWLQDSPAAGLTRNIAGGAETSRARVLTDDELRKTWGIPAPHGPLFRFLLLTGARIGEAQRASWVHIDGDLWHIPAEHSKNGQAHVVHLCPLARAELQARPQGSGNIFGLTSDTAVQAFLKRWCNREGIAPRFTPHDLRRTASTRMNAAGVAPHIVEKCLNHTLQGVMAVYNRADYFAERGAAFATLGKEIERVITSTGESTNGKRDQGDRREAVRLVA